MSADETREALLNATVRVVAREGLRGLTYRAVAQEAGVTHGLVTHYFGTWDGLVLAAFREKARNRDALERLSPGTGDINAIGAHLPKTVEEAGDEERYQYEMILEAFRKPEYLDEVRGLYNRFLAGVEEELGLAGADRTGTLAQVVFAALDGLVLQQLMTGDATRTEGAVRRLQSLIRSDIAISRLRASFGDL